MSTTIEQRTWKARIRVTVEHEGSQYEDISYVGGGTQIEIELIQNLRTRERSPRDIIHSLNEWNAATVPRPHTFDFSFEIPMNIQAARLFKYLQRDNKYFKLYIEENQDFVPEELDGVEQWALTMVLLDHAWVEDADQTITGITVPRLVVSGGALRTAVGPNAEPYGEYPYFPGRQ
jgi:hypothetical protein